MRGSLRETLLPVALLGVELAVGEVVVLLAGHELQANLIVELFVLLADQPVDLLHPHVVLFQPRLVGVLELEGALRLLLPAGVHEGGSGAVLLVIDGRLRLVLGFNWQLTAGSPDSAGERRALITNALLEDFPAALLIEKLFAGLVPEGDEAVYALGLSLLAVALLELAEEGLLDPRVLVVVGVVEAVHAVGGAVRVVPDELLRLVELLVLQELLRLRERRVRKDRLQVVVLDRRFRWVLHPVIKLSNPVLKLWATPVSEIRPEDTDSDYEMERQSSHGNDHTKLRGKSSLSLKFLYSSKRELLVIFFSTERLMSCSITFSFHSRVPRYFSEMRMDSMKFSSSAISELISSSQRKQFSTGSLGMVRRDLRRQSQNPSSLRFTRTVFCLLGMTATSFLRRSGKLRFLPWLSSERWEWKLKAAFSSLMKKFRISTSTSPISGQSLMCSFDFSQTLIANSRRQFSIFSKPSGERSLRMSWREQKNSKRRMRLQMILISRKLFSLLLSSCVLLQAREASTMMQTSFSMSSDTSRFFFSISTNMRDSFTSSLIFPWQRKLSAGSSTIAPRGRPTARTASAGCRWPRCRAAPPARCTSDCTSSSPSS